MGVQVLALSLSFLGAAWDYVKQYQVGIDYTSSQDVVDTSYEAPLAGSLGKGCSAVAGHDDRQQCRVSVEGGHSGGLGVFLQQAFKRQGTFYFKPDLSFGMRYLNGATRPDDVTPPLTSLNVSLLATVVKPYLQFGITPASTWPDIFLSLGPAIQLAAGQVSVNGQRKNVAMVTSSGGLIGGFFEAEIVLWRFGDGALSIDESFDATGSGRGTTLYPGSSDGMSDFRGAFRHSESGGVHGFGIKLVTPWP